MNRNLQYIAPLLVVIASSIALFFLYSLFFEGESLIASPRGPWIDTGPPIWINWSTAEIMNQAFRAGHFPLWSDTIGIGVPLVADPHLSYFSPFSFILYLAPNSYGWDVMVLMKASLTLVFAYALALRLGLNAWFGAWAAVLYGFSGHVFQYLHHFHTNSLVFLPLCLIAVVDIFERRYRRGLVFAAVGLPLMIFGGGLLDVIQLSLLLVFISILYFVSGREAGLPAYSARITGIVVAAVIFVLSIAVAAIWILPYVELRELAIPPRPNRSAALYNNQWYLFGLFMKNSMAPVVDVSHWFMKQIQYLSIIALPGFLLGAYALIISKSRYRYVYLSMFILASLQLLKVYGFPPLQVINNIPVLQDVRWEKYTGLYTLSFYFISAYGYQTIFSGKLARAVWLMLFSSAIVLVLGVSYQQAHDLSWDIDLLRYLALALYPLFVFVIWRTRPGEVGVIRTLLVLLTSGVVLYQVSIDTNTRFDKRLEIFQNDAVVAAALEVSDTGRFFPIAASGPRTWSADGLNDVRDISVVHVSRYHKFFKKIIEKDKRCWHNFVLCSSRANKVYLDGLRWIGVDTLILTKEQLALLEDNPDKGWVLSGSYQEYHFVKLDNVVPLISVITPSTISAERPTIAGIRDSLSSGKNVAYLEGVNHNQISTIPAPDWSVDSISKNGVDTTIEMTSSQAAYLLVKQQYFPGWLASISGQSVPIYKANYLFQAIPIPAGRSTVLLRYRPTSVLLGALLSIAAILILIGIYKFIKPAQLNTEPIQP